MLSAVRWLLVRCRARAIIRTFSVFVYFGSFVVCTDAEQVVINKNLKIEGVAVGNENLALIMPANVIANTTSLASMNPIAAIVMLLTWMYLSAYVFLFGAELNSELEHQTAEDSTTLHGMSEYLDQVRDGQVAGLRV